MNVGALKDIVEIYRQTVSPGDGGSPVKSYEKIVTMRGNWSQVAGTDFIMSNVQLNTRKGTLLTRFYPGADERLFIKINYSDMYEVVTFNHKDRVSTLWNLSFLTKRV